MDTKFTIIYDEHENETLERRKEFESNIDIQKTVYKYGELFRQDELLNDESRTHDIAKISRVKPISRIILVYNYYIEIRMLLLMKNYVLKTFKKLGAIAKRRENIKNLERFCELMKSANEKQKVLFLHVIHHSLLFHHNPRGYTTRY